MGETGRRDNTELEWICRAVLPSRFEEFRRVPIRAEYYPYVGLTHTIRRKGAGWVIRLSDHCRGAPTFVLEAIVCLLACKVTRRRAPAPLAEAYERFRKSEAVQEAVKERRLLRGRKLIRGAEGRHHSLLKTFEDLNSRYFGGRIEIRRIGWGPRRGWSRLGHYDPLHQTITISPVLDSALVPASALGFVVYHEMLHAVFDDCSAKSRRRHHPPSFRRAERGYEGYAAARKFLKRYSSSRGLLRS